MLRPAHSYGRMEPTSIQQRCTIGPRWVMNWQSELAPGLIRHRINGELTREWSRRAAERTGRRAAQSQTFVRHHTVNGEPRWISRLNNSKEWRDEGSGAVQPS